MEDYVVNLRETNDKPMIIVGAIFLCLSWIAVGLRTYTRVILLKAFRWDDRFMFIAQATFTTYLGFMFAGISFGVGHHNAAIKDKNREVTAMKWQALSIASYLIVMMFIKLSIGFFLLRLAVSMAYIWVLRASLVTVCIFSLVIFFWNIFQCSPVEKQWDYRLDGGWCVNPDEIVSVAYAVSAMTIITDFFYALIPIPMVWNVKMTFEAKVTVVMILGLGILASIATLVRIRFLPDLANLDDILYASNTAMVFTIVEPGLAIIAASLATIRPLLRVLRVRGFESADHSQISGPTIPLPNNNARAAAAAAATTRRVPRHRRFFQFYGVEEMTLTENTTVTMNTLLSVTGGGQGAGGPKAQSIHLGSMVVNEGNEEALLPTGPPLRSGVRKEDEGSDGDVGPQVRWSERSATSSEQIYDLEAQSQEDSGIGLGPLPKSGDARGYIR